MSTPPKSQATLSAPDSRTLALTGRLDADGVAGVWRAALAWAATVPAGARLDLSAVTYLDGAGAALVLELEQRLGRTAAGALEVFGLGTDHAALLELYRQEAPPVQPPVEPQRPDFIELVGRKSAQAVSGFARFVAFVGECAAALAWAVRRPHKVRWRDVLAVAEDVGVYGLPIIVLIGFLMGLILAFQSAVPLKRFGAELYVADLLGISMVREMGALVTAILLTGRSGSAFAAELGTMTVNEEVNALTTMGLSPVKFLALPRILAAVAVMPALTAFFIVFAFAGGSLVVMSFGYPLVTYLDRLTAMVQVADLAGGLFKAMAFSVIVAAVGCQKGLATGSGSRAVGASTTSAVVMGLVLIAVVDGIFAGVFYVLGI